MAKTIKDGSEIKTAIAIGDEPISYELAFISGFESVRPTRGDLGAELRSPLLDRKMHPRGVLKLSIKVRGIDSKGPGSGFVLESFQIESIAEYLRRQETIKKALEAEIRKSAAHFEASDQLENSNIWRQAKLQAVAIFPRMMISNEDLAQLRKATPDATPEDIDKWFDKPATRSCFTVGLRLAWDEEHMYDVVFRDGTLVSMETA